MISDKTVMISFEDASETVMNNCFGTGNEIVRLNESLGRILADAVLSDTDLPPFDKSSVDGFACRKTDLGNELEIVETVPAGVWPSRTIGRNQCSRIMTGAPVPGGADCVIMVEETQALSDGRIKCTASFRKENIARKGEDAAKGMPVLKPGRIIKPQDIAVMASVGNVSVSVARKPSIAVISSGSELVEPHQVPGVSQIRNSNSGQLMAQVSLAGGSGRYYGITPDDEAITLSVIEKAMSENEVILITGGVSMGDFDFVPVVLERAGFKLLFSRVAIQPGKPTTFGIHTRCVVFGLPGNPVSSFIQFELLVKPFICKMMGHDFKPSVCFLPMNETFTRKNADRMGLIPVRITSGRKVIPVEYHGSGHISALPDADGIITLPAGTTVIEKDEIVSVRQI